MKKLIHKSVLCVALFLVSAQSFGKITLETRDSIYQVMLKEKDTFTKLDLRYKFIAQTEPFYLDSILIYLERWELEYKEQKYALGEGRMRSMRSWYLNYTNQFETALKLAHSALALQDSIKDSTGISRTLNRIGILNLQFNRLDESVTYLKHALQMALYQQDTALIDMCLNNLGIATSRLDQREEAISYYYKSYEIRRLKKDTFWMAYSLYNIAEAFYDSDDIDSSGYYYKEAVKLFQRSSKRDVVPSMVHTGLAKYYAAKGQPALGLPHAEKAVIKARKRGIQDSEIQGLRILADLQFDNGLFKDAYQTLTDYDLLRNRVDSANNARTAAEIEEKYQNAQQAAEINALKASNLETEKNAQKTWYRALIAIISAIVISVMAVLLALYFIQKKKAKDKLNRASFEKQVSDLKLMALQAQMNPHFIFNSINTAQNFVIKTEREKAYEYLAKFAKLIRSVLENSNNVFIPLQDEISQITRYLELESIRFDNKFTYEIDIDDNLNQGVFEIPTMVLQPCIENAIIHGLVNKSDGHGHLSIRLVLSDSLIQIAIEDNGVGRKRAKQIKESKQHHYSSTASINIQQRLDIIQTNTSEQINYHIIDLLDEGKAVGTRVELALPYR